MNGGFGANHTIAVEEELADLHFRTCKRSALDEEVSLVAEVVGAESNWMVVHVGTGKRRWKKKPG